jgi:diguanylate cyclase (GGDEF)-like protein
MAGIYWLHARRIWFRTFLGIMLGTGAPLGWLGIRILSGGSYWEELTGHTGLYSYMLITTTAVFGLFGAYVGHHESLFEAQSVTDGLTGLKNLRYFFARLEEVHAESHRRASPIALAIVDLDDFKRINDGYGHPTGDRVLTVVADSIASVVRRGDTAARVGGEEFALLLPGKTSAEAHQIGERVCDAIRGVSIQAHHGLGNIRLTASVGVVSTDRWIAATPGPICCRRCGPVPCQADWS